MTADPAVASGTDLSRPERFVFLLLENFTLIAFASAIEPLRLANRMAGRTLYQWQVVSETGGPVAASNGVVLQADGGLGEVACGAAIIVVGGIQVKQAISRPVLTWLRREARKGLSTAGVGLTFGASEFNQALFFLTEQALQDFRVADGWELGADAAVVVQNDGAAAGLTSTQINRPIQEVVFGQRGLIADASLTGAKYSRIIR